MIIGDQEIFRLLMQKSMRKTYVKVDIDEVLLHSNHREI